MRKHILKKLNNFSLKKKLLIIYIGCVILPLIITDSLIFCIVANEEKDKIKMEQKAVAESTFYDLENKITDATNLASKIYINKTVNEFLETKFGTKTGYYLESRKFLNGMIIGFNMRNTAVSFCTNNLTMISGGSFLGIDIFENEEWMKTVRQKDKNAILSFYYLDNKKVYSTPRRQISYIRKLNYFKKPSFEKYVKCDINYSSVVSDLTNKNSSYPIYVCSGDKILYSNVGYNEYNAPFELLKGDEEIGYKIDKEMFGMPISVIVLKTEYPIVPILKDRALLILFMVSINIMLPILLVQLINESISQRMKKLNDSFSDVDINNLKVVNDVEGNDEIANLMRNYNRMVNKSNELIKTVYKDKMEKQEIDLARQNAELLALQSQINPHFLFNTLESIRMHSVLKKEKETADMIAKLSVLVRKNVEWKNDLSLVSDEMKFIENYLELQKYRFGDRLDFEIFVEPNCLSFYLPKLTLVTFVENACVHGMENKAGVCKIYVRVFKFEQSLFLEVEDTGSGMDEKQVEELKYKMENSTIDMVKNSNHIGIVNACLRLNMITDYKVKFTIESEKGVGTYLALQIPIIKLTREEVEFNVKSIDC